MEHYIDEEERSRLHQLIISTKTPLYVPDCSELTVTMARCTDNRKVWYEWAVEAHGWNVMIGSDNRRIRLGGGDLSSSKAVGCMM